MDFTNRKIIYWILIILAVALIAIVAWFTIIPRKIPEIKCAKEGERIGAQGMPEVCCSGLKPVGGWPGGYQGDCSISPPPAGLSICSNCGNGICNAHNGENKCNCPEDCQ